jgi:hypothetical protein
MYICGGVYVYLWGCECIIGGRAYIIPLFLTYYYSDIRANLRYYNYIIIEL